MTVFMFQGQGTQRKGMGRNVFNRYAETISRASDLLGYSLEELCLENPGGALARTQYAQPAIYLVNALKFFDILDAGTPLPNFALGHSLGEYNALLAAGVFDFEVGLRLVAKRGELMGRVTGGGMAAVSGLDSGAVTELLAAHGLADELQVACENAPDQLVISGSGKAVAAAAAIFANVKDGVSYTLLRTSGAFHSRHMAQAREDFAHYIDSAQLQLSEPVIPVIANLDARTYTSATTKRNIVEQITQPVMWAASLRYLMEQGETDFREIGTGRVLTELMDRNWAGADTIASRTLN